MKIIRNIVTFLPNFQSKKTEPIKKDIKLRLPKLDFNKVQNSSIKISELKSILAKKDLLLAYHSKEQKALHEMLDIVATTLKDMEQVNTYVNKTIKA